jgi:hypothetical protein
MTWQKKKNRRKTSVVYKLKIFECKSMSSIERAIRKKKKLATEFLIRKKNRGKRKLVERKLGDTKIDGREDSLEV